MAIRRQSTAINRTGSSSLTLVKADCDVSIGTYLSGTYLGQPWRYQVGGKSYGQNGLVTYQGVADGDRIQKMATQSVALGTGLQTAQVICEKVLDAIGLKLTWHGDFDWRPTNLALSSYLDFFLKANFIYGGGERVSDFLSKLLDWASDIPDLCYRVTYYFDKVDIAQGKGVSERRYGVHHDGAGLLFQGVSYNEEVRDFIYSTQKTVTGGGGGGGSTVPQRTPLVPQYTDEAGVEPKYYSGTYDEGGFRNTYVDGLLTESISATCFDPGMKDIYPKVGHNYYYEKMTDGDEGVPYYRMIQEGSSEVTLVNKGTTEKPDLKEVTVDKVSKYGYTENKYAPKTSSTSNWYVCIQRQYQDGKPVSDLVYRITSQGHCYCEKYVYVSKLWSKSSTTKRLVPILQEKTLLEGYPPAGVANQRRMAEDDYTALEQQTKNVELEGAYKPSNTFPIACQQSDAVTWSRLVECINKYPSVRYCKATARVYGATAAICNGDNVDIPHHGTMEVQEAIWCSDPKTSYQQISCLRMEKVS